ncbi:MAG: TolC family protein [Candidatus Eisenbacteria bacterium]
MASRLTHHWAALACAVLLGTTLPERSTAQPQPLTLQGALEAARTAHPELRVANADIAIARADSSYARIRAFNPELELQVARGGQSLGSGEESKIDVGISQEFELWGKGAARQSLASARAQTSAAEWRAKLQQIESNVRARFARALFLQDRGTVIHALADLDRRVVRASQARVRDGSMTPVTARLTELDLFRLETQGRRTNGELRQAIVALGLAMGQAIPDSTRLDGDLHVDSLSTPEDSVVALGMRSRADRDVLRRRIAERQAELRLAERANRPNITLGVGLSRERQSLSGDDFTGDPAIIDGITGANSTDNLWTARISTPLPLWQKNQAERAHASASIARSQAEFDRYSLQTQLEITGAVRRFQDAAGLYGLYLARSARVRQDLVLIREAYADGRIPLDSYLTQKGRLVDTLLDQLEAGDAYWAARAELESEVGLDLAHMNGGVDR